MLALLHGKQEMFYLWFNNTITLYIIFYLAKLFFQFLIELKSQESIPTWSPGNLCSLRVILASWYWAVLLILFGWKKIVLFREFSGVFLDFLFFLFWQLHILKMFVRILVWFFSNFWTIIYILSSTFAVMEYNFKKIIKPQTQNHQISIQNSLIS